MESAPYAKPETIEQKKIENTQKNISLTHDNKIFSIEFKNEIDFLSVTASYQESLFPVKFTGKFSLNDIKKVGLFRVYDSIDECLFEIFEGLNSNPSITEKDNLNIIIKVPLHTKKFPEITFILKKVEKSESQKYDELVDVLLKMKNEKDEKDKEIKELKNKVENLEKLLNVKKEQKTNIEDSEEKFKTPTGENNEKIIKYKGGTLLERFEIQLSNIFFDKNQNIPLVDICELKKLSAALIIKYNNRKSPLETAKDFFEKNLNNNIDEITKMNIDFKRTNVFVEIDDSNYLKKIETNNEQNFIKEFKEKYGILNDDISEKELKKEIEYRKYNEDEIIRVILKKLGYL